MHRVVNSFVPIWAKEGRDPRDQRWAFRAMVACAIALAVLSGCSSPAPRFRAEPDRAAKGREDEDEIRFAAKIREETRREDDRAVDTEKVRERLAARPKPAGAYSNKTPAGLDRDRVLLDVVSFLGVPYLYGGEGREGIDCSGFTSLVYQNAVRRSLPRSAREQFDVGMAVEKNDLQFGDLVFFNTTGQRPSHVGIYIEDDLFAHASVTQGVTFSSLESTYYRNRFVGARRVVE